jgi:hypothetical protein
MDSSVSEFVSHILSNNKGKLMDDKYPKAVRAAIILDKVKLEMVKMIEDIPHQSRAVTINKGFIRAVNHIQDYIAELEAAQWKTRSEE